MAIFCKGVEAKRRRRGR